MRESEKLFCLHCLYSSDRLACFDARKPQNTVCLINLQAVATVPEVLNCHTQNILYIHVVTKNRLETPSGVRAAHVFVLKCPCGLFNVGCSYLKEKACSL